MIYTNNSLVDCFHEPHEDKGAFLYHVVITDKEQLRKWIRERLRHFKKREIRCILNRFNETGRYIVTTSK